MNGKIHCNTTTSTIDNDPKTVGAQRNPPLTKNRSEGWFSSATNVTTFSHAGFEILKTSKTCCETNRFQKRANSRNALFFNAGTSRYVFTTDVSVNEVQAFIRDLVLVMGWFTALDRCGR